MDLFFPAWRILAICLEKKEGERVAYRTDIDVSYSDRKGLRGKSVPLPCENSATIRKFRFAIHTCLRASYMGHIDISDAGQNSENTQISNPGAEFHVTRTHTQNN